MPTDSGNTLPMNWQDRIIADPKAERAERDAFHEQVLANYPQLKPDDIRAAHAYAAEVMKDQRAYPLPT